MAEDVIVTFGAKIDELIHGTEDAKEHIESFKESVATVAELVGIAFGVEAIKSFIESMGELGLQTERVMATLGVSSEEVGQLSGVAKLTGTTIEGLSLGIERMSLNIQRAAKDGFTPGAAALKVLGLNAQELIGLPATEYLLKLADATEKFNPSLNLTNALMAVGGRGIQQLIPSLALGAEHFRELMEAVQATGATLTDMQTRALVQTHEQITLLGLTIQGLKNAMMAELEPAIDAVVRQMTGFVAEIRDSIKEGGAWSYVLSGLAETLKVIAAAFAGVAAMIRFLSVEVKAFWDTTAENGEAVGKRLRSDLDSISTDFKKTLSDLYGPPRVTVTPTSQKANAGAIDFTGAQGAKDAAEAAQAQIKQAEIAYQTKIQLLQAELKMHMITQSEETAETIKAIGQRSLAEINALTEAQSHMAKSSSEWKKLEDEKTSITLKAVKDRQQTELKAMEETSRQWQAVGSTIASAFNSQTKALLEGTVTFSGAMKNIFEDLVVALINELEKLIIKELVVEGLKIAIFGPSAAIPSFDIGTNYVPQTGLALVHQGEAIIPASQNTGAGYTGQGTSITINASQLDTTGMRGMLMKLVPQISQMVASHQSQQFSTYGAH